MGTIPTSPESVPQDIRKALQTREAALRLSYNEIVSGVHRLLKQGIPSEVISQVVLQAVEAVSKDFVSMTQRKASPRTEIQTPDAGISR